MIDQDVGFKREPVGKDIPVTVELDCEKKSLSFTLHGRKVVAFSDMDIRPTKPLSLAVLLEKHSIVTLLRYESEPV